MATKTQQEKDIEKYYTEKTSREEMALTNNYQSKLNDFRGQKKDNETEIADANRGLYVDYMRDASTLPEQLARSGITGGAVESSNLRLMSDYRNNVAQNNRALFDANEDIDNDIATLTAEYKTAMAESRAENEFNKAQALEAATKPAAGLSENQKAAIDAYKATGNKAYLEGYFDSTTIGTITGETSGTGDATFSQLWNEYEKTGMYTPLFDMYSPDKVIEAAKFNIDAYNFEHGTSKTVDEREIWADWLDYIRDTISPNNSVTLDTFGHASKISVDGYDVDVGTLASDLANSSGDYAITKDKSGNYQIIKKNKTNNQGETGNQVTTDGSQGNQTTQTNPVIDPLLLTGLNTLNPNIKIPGADKDSEMLNKAFANKTREDKRITNVNVGDYVFIDGYGWMTLNEMELAMKNNPPLIDETTTNGRTYTYTMTRVGSSINRLQQAALRTSNNYYYLSNGKVVAIDENSPKAQQLIADQAKKNEEARTKRNQQKQ